MRRLHACSIGQDDSETCNKNFIILLFVYYRWLDNKIIRVPLIIENYENENYNPQVIHNLQ